MRYTVTEKQEIIYLVDRSELGVNKTLQQLGIHKSTFYKWYKAYLDKEPEVWSLERKPVSSGTPYPVNKSN